MPGPGIPIWARNAPPLARGGIPIPNQKGIAVASTVAWACVRDGVVLGWLVMIAMDDKLGPGILKSNGSPSAASRGLRSTLVLPALCHACGVSLNWLQLHELLFPEAAKALFRYWPKSQGSRAPSPAWYEKANRPPLPLGTDTAPVCLGNLPWHQLPVLEHPATC